MSTREDRFGAPWLPDVFAVIFRGRHPVLHGNTDDLVRIGDDWMSVADALTHIAQVGDAELVGRLDIARGLTFEEPADGERFEGLRRDVGAAQPEPSRSGSEARARTAFAELDARDGRPPIGVLADRGGALASISAVLGGNAPRLALIIDSPDLLWQDPQGSAAAERQLLGQLRRIATLAHAGRHQLLFVLRRGTTAPNWLLNSAPYLETVLIPLPDRRERLIRLQSDARGFHGSDELSDDERQERCDELAGLADGLTLAETAALAASSRVERLTLAEPRRLISVARFGRRDVPLTITRERARAAPAELGQRLVGQDGALEAVSRALRAAASGIDAASDADGSRRKPLFTLVFAGGTGVGKTELAKAIAELVFGDERSLVRFDMSEFQQEHEVARLIGAPPGYIGHEAGGQLTRAVAGRPSTLLLFDEFEKAAPRILDIFIHVIDDGRLTDGNGRTVDFTGTGIIFTTNLGADVVYRRMSEADSQYSYDELQTEVRSAIESSLRPELVGRLQSGIVVFDALSAQSIAGIGRKALTRVVLSARRQAGLNIELDEPALLALIDSELRRRGGEGGLARALVTGGRAIEAAVGDVISGPLQEWIVEHDPEPGTALSLSSNEGGVVVRVRP
jgi:AAA domain (Cdc48 subfamily)